MIPGRPYDLVDAATPARLRRLQLFLNSLDAREFTRLGERHVRHDALRTPADLANWLKEAGAGSMSVSVDEHREALELRDAIRSLLSSEAGLSTPERSWIDEVLGRFCLRLGETDGQLALGSDGTGVGEVLGEMVADIAIALADGSWGRMRMCGADDCLWVFYDGSRGGQGRWCQMEPCGNRVKTRAYRARRRVPGRVGRARD